MQVGRQMAMWGLAAALLSIPAPARTRNVVGFYLTPSFGYSWYRIKSIEIEESFIIPPPEEDTDEPPAIDDAYRTVGRKSYYEGSQITVGGSAGLAIAAVNIGLRYEWTPLEVSGYAKSYHYRPEEMTASGRRFLDSGQIDVQRLLCELSYGIPVQKLLISFRTRVGAVFIEDNGLIMGRAVGSGDGFSGDLGLKLDIVPLSFLSVGLDGWYGLFSFTGNYEGTFGTAGGLSASITFKL